MGPNDYYGYISDNENTYYNDSEVAGRLHIEFSWDAGTEDVPEGYYFDITHDSDVAASPLRCWLPAITWVEYSNPGWINFVVGTDGTLYTDDSMCTVAKAPVTPTPSTTPTVTPTPSVTPSVSCDYKVSGLVLDNSTLEPIPYADVWLEYSDHSTYGTFKSATDGSYTIWEYVPRPPGTVLAWASHSDYMTGNAATTWDCFSYHSGINIELDRIFTPSPSPTLTPTPTPSTTPTPCCMPTPIYLVLDSGDYNGDGTSDVAVFRQSTGMWAIREISRLYFGLPGDIPVCGDYDGDMTTEIGIFRRSSGLWSIRDITRTYFGTSSDFPVPSDYDGDGYCDIGIFRDSSGLWAIRNLTRTYFGTQGDSPVPGDYDGDGTADIALARGSSGLWAIRNLSRLYFGGVEDIAVPGVYGGGGMTDVAIFRRSSGLWAIRGVTRVYLGSAGDQAVPADYDGDSAAEIGIFRPSSGLWEIRDLTRAYFGSSGDIPVTR